MANLNKKTIMEGLIVHAPPVPSGFVPTMPKGVKEPVKPEFSHEEYSWKKYEEGCTEKQMCNNFKNYTPVETEYFHSHRFVMKNYELAKVAYDSQYNIQQIAQWPWFYANAVMDAAEIQGFTYA